MLVVGAGPAGLVCGITLARYGIDVLVVDKRAGGSTLSRSLVVSTRGMELMRRFGLESDVRSVAAEVKIRAWVTASLGSEEGSEMPAGYPSDAEAAAVSPSRPAWVAQDHHEPILLEHLCSLPSATVRFGYEAKSLASDGSGVTATLAEVGSGHTQQVHAAYVVAADGAHSTVRDHLGIAMTGPDDLADFERIEFTAPLWDLVGDRRYGLYVITRPDAAATLGPRGLGDRWFLAREVPVGSRALVDLSEDDRIDLIRRATGSPDVHPAIERVNAWTFAAQVAERYAAGRCFLIGDAAHRMTPRGGTGMNTAIQDGFDLGWKLAWVLRGWSGVGLLDSYERERRPVAEHNVHRASQPTGMRQETDQALPWDLNGRIPHRWVPNADQPTSTIDLLGDGLTLFTGRSDPRWLDLVASAAPNAPVDIRTLDTATLEALEVPPTGALLARPDGREIARWANLKQVATPDRAGSG